MSGRLDGQAFVSKSINVQLTNDAIINSKSKCILTIELM